MIQISEPYIPHSPLNSVVECIYVNFGNSSYENHIQFPTLRQELFINMGDKFELSKGKNTIDSKFWLSGIQTSSTTVTTDGEHYTIGVLFKPWGLHKALNINASQLTDSFQDITTFLDSKFINTIKDLYQDKDICMIIEDLLLQQFEFKKINETISPLFEDLSSHEFIKALEHTPLNRKSIIQYFHQISGITPTQYLQLKMANEAIEQIKSNPLKKLIDIGNDIGFYDQSHFIRSLKKYTGMTPKEIRNNSKK